FGRAEEVGRETRESVEPVAGADPQITQAYRDGQRAWLRRETREAGPARRRRRPHIRRTKLEGGDIQVEVVDHPCLDAWRPIERVVAISNVEGVAAVRPALGTRCPELGAPQAARRTGRRAENGLRGGGRGVQRQSNCEQVVRPARVRAKEVHPRAGALGEAVAVEDVTRAVGNRVVANRPARLQGDVLILEDSISGELPRELVARVGASPLMVVRVHDMRGTEVVDIDGEEVEQVAVAAAAEPAGADATKVVRLGAHLDATEVRTGIKR